MLLSEVEQEDGRWESRRSAAKTRDATLRRHERIADALAVPAVKARTGASDLTPQNNILNKLRNASLLETRPPSPRRSHSTHTRIQRRAPFASNHLRGRQTKARNGRTTRQEHIRELSSLYTTHSKHSSSTSASRLLRLLSSTLSHHDTARTPSRCPTANMMSGEAWYEIPLSTTNDSWRSIAADEGQS